MVTTPQGEKITFKRNTGLCTRMPYIDTREHADGVTMLETFCKRFDGYTKQQVEKALEARKLQAALAHPTDKQMKDLIIKGSIKNCDVQVQDVTNT